MAFETTERSNRMTRALLLGDQLEMLWSGQFEGVPRALDCQAGTGCLLMSDRLEQIRWHHDEITTRTIPHDGARDVVVNDDGESILIYSDRAEKVPEESEES